MVGLCALVLALVILGSFGLTVVNPNAAKIVLLFGDYQGTLKAPGLRAIIGNKRSGENSVAAEGILVSPRHC